MTNTRSDPRLTKLNCRLAKDLETKTGLNASETYKEMINGVEDEDLFNLIASSLIGEKVKLLSVPKGRPLGNCFQNAWAEEKATGNKAYWGYMTLHFNGRAQQAVVHAFNKDKKGNYYDTAEFPHGMPPALVSVVAEAHTAYNGMAYDYYYIKTKGRVFRWSSPWGNNFEAPDRAVEAHIQADRVSWRRVG